MNATHLTDDTFDETLAASGVPVLVDFTAEWCPPCRVMEPVLNGLAADLAGRLAVARVDVDHSPGLVRRYRILSMPTFVLFVDGAERLRMVGARPRPLLERELAEVLTGAGHGPRHATAV